MTPPKWLSRVPYLLVAGTLLSSGRNYLPVLITLLFLTGSAANAKAATTTTILSVTSGGQAVTTVSAGSVVTLTATVSSGGAAVTAGQVDFCDATSPHCTDVHLLGTAQLTKSGTATFRLRPRWGNNTYQAIFVGTSSAQTSASAPAALAVTGKSVTSTILAQTGTSGNYTLTAEVGGATATVPTGNVTFLDVTNNKAVLGTGALGPGTTGLTFLNSSNPQVSTPLQIAIADFNQDGILDLAVLNADLATVTVLLGNGDGRFTTASASPHSQDSISVGITSADFNGDGKADLAIVNGDNNTITVMLGNGDGTFNATAATKTTATCGGICPTAIVAADFNHDGILDLVTSAGVVLVGNGDGTFTAKPSLAGTGGATSIAVGDFDGDGNLDLAMSSGAVFLGNGDGTFRVGTALPATGPIVAGDFNADGKVDLAVASTPTVLGGPPFTVVPTNMITILSGNGDGTFSLHLTGPLTSNLPSAIVVGDFNADGIADLAVLDYEDMAGSVGGVPDPAQISVLLGDGTGNFSFATSPLNENFMYGGVNPPEALAVGDFNGDGIADLAQPFWSGYAVNVSSPLYVPDAVNVLLAEQSNASASVAGINVPSSDTIAANYAGDNNNPPSSSATTNLNPPPTLTAGALSSVSPGATATATLTLVAGPMYSGTMTLTCALTSSPSGAQSLPTCTLNPASLTVAAGATTTSALAVKTTAATSTAAMLPLQRDFGGGVALACLFMLGIPRLRRQGFAKLAFLLLTAAVVATGCGGGGSSTGPKTGPSTPATTAGPYAFTVTGTDTATPGTITTTATVTVQ